MHNPAGHLARIIYVEVTTVPASYGWALNGLQTLVKVQFDTADGPDEVVLTSERAKALDVFDAYRQRRWIPIPTPDAPA
jgi:hypothetical protein